MNPPVEATVSMPEPSAESLWISPVSPPHQMSPLISTAIPSGWRSRGSLNMPSKKTSALSRDSMGSKVLSHLRAGGTTSLSGWYLRRYGLVWVREPLLGHEGITVRVPVVRYPASFQTLTIFVNPPDFIRREEPRTRRCRA